MIECVYCQRSVGRGDVGWILSYHLEFHSWELMGDLTRENMCFREIDFRRISCRILKDIKGCVVRTNGKRFNLL